MATNSYISEQSPAGDFESISVSTTAIGGTAAKLAIAQLGGFKKRAVMMFISVETNSMRVRWDGTAPTASVGHLLAAGDTLTISGEQNCANVKLIRVSADGTAMVTYYYNL
jgi:hypothetical protein